MKLLRYIIHRMLETLLLSTSICVTVLHNHIRLVHPLQVEILSSLSHPNVIEFYGTVVGQPKGFGDCIVTGWSSVHGNDCLVYTLLVLLHK